MSATTDQGTAGILRGRTPREPASLVFVVAMAIAATAASVIASWSAFRYGFDYLDLLTGGHRFLAGTDLYAGSGPAYGFVGPPFEAMFVAPFAAVGSSQITFCSAPKVLKLFNRLLA